VDCTPPPGASDICRSRGVGPQSPHERSGRAIWRGRVAHRRRITHGLSQAGRDARIRCLVRKGQSDRGAGPSANRVEADAVGDRPDLTAMVLTEYDRTLQRVLAVTGHTRLLEDRRVLSWAIELRNPYVDALSHLQLRALRALRNRKTPQRERERAERVFQLSVNGVAAGLQNTG